MQACYVKKNREKCLAPWCTITSDNSNHNHDSGCCMNYSLIMEFSSRRKDKKAPSPIPYCQPSLPRIQTSTCPSPTILSSVVPAQLSGNPTKNPAKGWNPDSSIVHASWALTGGALEFGSTSRGRSPNSSIYRKSSVDSMGWVKHSCLLVPLSPSYASPVFSNCAGSFCLFSPSVSCIRPWDPWEHSLQLTRLWAPSPLHSMET